MGSEHQPSDEALVADVGDQRHDALSEIYRRHGGAVWSVAKRVCGQDELAEEVCRTVFTELWSHPGRFDRSRSTLRSWLVARAHACAVERARAHDGTPAAPPSTEHEVAAHAAALPAEARRAVDRLAPAEREALLLTYFGGRAPSQTARLLGTLDGNVKSYIRNGLSNLRRTLDVEGVTR